MSDAIEQQDEGGVQQEALARLDRAAAEFDVVGALQALYDSDVLSGLRGRLQKRWPSIRNELDYYHVIAAGVDNFTAELEKGRRVVDPIAFIWKVVDRRANDETRRRRREAPTDPQALKGRILPVLPAEVGPALQEARRLLPRVHGEDARAVLGLILDAVEQGREDLTSREIGETLGLSEVNARQLRKRAFDRLVRLARGEQAAGRGFFLPELWDDDEELLVEPDGGDQDDED